jgi:Fe-S cluster biogenesis protein NfuA
MTPADEGLRERVARVVADEIMPALEMDATDVEVVGCDRGVVQVRLSGTCGNCPSSARAVIMGLEDELRKRIPEVEYLETVM